ncbi:MAG: 16S rRNA (adenine(1518)-N(6)/adenine(1519)-N(6))-dimethyltransferase RsmA [Candidatus Paceibacterota bacterium]|jgi:16S rRNA (adenine1518-N6/adenine1519-N6)-dimethyltransferase
MFAKKSLGQNWLNSPSALQSIIEAGQVTDRDTVLEIGPGQGALTSKLLAVGCQVIAIEKDRDLMPILKEKFVSEISSGKLILINDDILNFNLEAKSSHLKAPYKLVANIPYYLTGQIIRKFLSAKNSPATAVLLVQKEVADRIVAKDKKESLLSIAVKIFGEPQYIKKVPAGAFRPIPKVDSAILLIDKINQDKLKSISISEEKFFDLLHRGFAQKRKLLASNLKISPTVLTECGVGEKARAENLTVENWLCLAAKI